MGRPTTKTDLLIAAAANYEKLNTLVSGLTEKELSTPFDFSGDEKKKEAHWKRDKNLRDIFIHLYEWHQLLLNWVYSNQNGDNKRFLPEPYNWKTYGDMNVEFWNKHQSTSLEDAKSMFWKSHDEVIKLAESASHYDWAMKKLKAHRKNCAKQYEETIM